MRRAVAAPPTDATGGGATTGRDLASILDVADAFDVVVLDQWGVLHDGTRPYPRVANAMARLRERGVRLAILSNSGKRASLNRERIVRIGIPLAPDDVVMTSGEALWSDIRSGRVELSRFRAVCGRPEDAPLWADGLNVEFVPVSDAEALLLMGLPDERPGDGAVAEQAARAREKTLNAALARGLPAFCTNPDLASPREDGSVPSVGALAKRYEEMGGTVNWYGKPYRPIFAALSAALGDPPAERVLMVGDSPMHDIAGGNGFGWRTLLVRDGLHAHHFGEAASIDDALGTLINDEAERPDHTIADLRA